MAMSEQKGKGLERKGIKIRWAKNRCKNIIAM